MSSPPAPFAFPPSQYWDGNDGPWSSFFFRVGSPPQYLRLLISTASQYTMVVLPSGCTADVGSNCPTSRGVLFDTNSSTSWNFLSNRYPGLEANLNYRTRASIGLDTVGLHIENHTGLTLDSQVVAAFRAPEFWVGSFGLGPGSNNVTDFDHPHPSYLTTLKARNAIPSLSWAYTAGASYRLKKVYGSLTLGGYDQSRFTPNSLSFSLAPDISRDLVVGIQAVTSTQSNGTSELLLPSGILSFVDSSLPYIWLPLDACQRFESTLGLTWDNASQLYLVDDALHDEIAAKNFTFTFRLGNLPVGGSTADIILPYASFDLMADYPLVPDKTRYFPLKRASNDTQYTLGRAFLQEAYLIADYERGNFSISQALFQENPQQDLVTIPSVNSSNATPQVVVKKSSSSALSPGSIAGTVASILFLGLLGLGFFLFLTKRWPFRRNLVIDHSDSVHEKVETTGDLANTVSEVPTSLEGIQMELEDKTAGKEGEVHSDHKIELQAQEEGALWHNLSNGCVSSSRQSQHTMVDGIIRHELPALSALPTAETHRGGKVGWDDR